MRSCKISDVGAAGLAKCLKQNSTLIEVNIKGNLITNVGAHALMDAVKENSTLARLKIFDNKLSASEKAIFVNCMVKHLQPPPIVEEEENVGEMLARGLLSGGSLALKGTLAMGMSAGKAGLKAGKGTLAMGISAGKSGLKAGQAGISAVKRGASKAEQKGSTVKIVPAK